MKKWIVVAVMFLSLAGCVPTTEQVLNLGQDVDLLMDKIDDQQSKLIAQIDKVQEHVTLVNEAVKLAKTLPEKAAAGIEASRPFNPYADEMVVGLGLLISIGGLFMRKSNKEATANAKLYATEHKKRQADKQGRENTLRKIAAENISSAASIKAVMYDEIGKARAANGV